MVFKDGKPLLVLGTPGGPTIFTTNYQVILNRLSHDMTLAEAVASPRVHHQWPPQGDDEIWFEGRWKEIPPMESLGYQVVRRQDIGDVQAIEIQGTEIQGVSDSRGTGSVAYE
jgi:gamma-glutamyltranspeptidase/glutathione hydrolase